MMPHLARKTMYCAPFLATALLLAPAPAQAGDEAVLELGKQIFKTDAKPRCGICHTLADAQAVGKIGPNLDDLKPKTDQVRQALEDGVGAMPAYKTLTEEQMEAIAHYVSEVAGKAK